MNPLTESDFEQARTDLQRLLAVLEQTIVGQEQLIHEVVVTCIAGGHCLIEGLPGLGKTQLARALALATGLDCSRIQCTPDLMPADLTGSDLLLRDSSGNQRLEFQQGPLFSPVVLVDEINRATAKTQSALLEAMQERQVTYAGVTRPLPRPFLVLATQNPIEIEGTYPLPEAQLDRFMSKLKITMPGPEALLRILDVSLDDEPTRHLAAVVNPDRLQDIMQLSQEILVSRHTRQSAVALLLLTHQSGAGRKFRYGASPRGLQALLRMARVEALLQGRLQVDRDDLAAVALPALRHRVIMTIESELEGVDTDALLGELLATWRDQP